MCCRGNQMLQRFKNIKHLASLKMHFEFCFTHPCSSIFVRTFRALMYDPPGLTRTQTRSTRTHARTHTHTHTVHAGNTKTGVQKGDERGFSASFFPLLITSSVRVRSEVASFNTLVRSKPEGRMETSSIAANTQYTFMTKFTKVADAGVELLTTVANHSC